MSHVRNRVSESPEPVGTPSVAVIDIQPERSEIRLEHDLAAILFGLRQCRELIAPGLRKLKEEREQKQTELDRVRAKPKPEPSTPEKLDEAPGSIRTALDRFWIKRFIVFQGMRHPEKMS